MSDYWLETIAKLRDRVAKLESEKIELMKKIESYEAILSAQRASEGKRC